MKPTNELEELLTKYFDHSTELFKLIKENDEKIKAIVARLEKLSIIKEKDEDDDN